MTRDPAALTPLTLLAPVRRGAENELTAGLPRLPGDALAGLADTHFARWVVVDQLRPGPPWPRPLPSWYLAYTSTFSGGIAAHIEQLRGCEAADAVWSHCTGYPGRVDRQRYHRWMRALSVPTHRSFQAYASTVEQIRAALAVRARHIELARQAQGLHDKDIQQAYLDRFGVA